MRSSRDTRLDAATASVSDLAIVKQERASDCGVATLATIAKYYACTVRYSKIVELVGTDSSGTNLLVLSRAAERLGFCTQGMKGTYDAIASVTLPAIVHLLSRTGRGHFVVLHRWNSRGVIVADPAVGIREIPRVEFCDSWTGYLLTVLPARDAYQRHETADGTAPTAFECPRSDASAVSRK